MVSRKYISRNIFNDKKLILGLVFSVMLLLFFIVLICAENPIIISPSQDSFFRGENFLGEEKINQGFSYVDEKSLVKDKLSLNKGLEFSLRSNEKNIPLENFSQFFQINERDIQIYTCQDLQNINNNLTDSYILMNDIDCSDTVNWNGGQGFEPIQDFSGLLDGRGHIISGLYINRQDINIGLFSCTKSQAKIKNVGLIETNISGIVRVGSLVGLNLGNISNSYSRGNIEGVNFIGGLVGLNKGAIYNSYSNCDISGINFIGGLVGRNQRGKIINSFSTGSVFGIEHVGGLVGGLSGVNFRGLEEGKIEQYKEFNTELIESGNPSLESLPTSIYGKIINSYWHNHSGNPNICYGSGDFGCVAISEENHPPYFYLINNSPMSSWDFDNVWSSINNGIDYPVLKVEETIEENIQIYTCQDLQNINNNLTDSYILMNDIDCSDTVNWNGGQGFEPLGNFNDYFTGILNGNGKIISNLYINRPGSNHVGLFGFVYYESEIKNLGLVNVDITGNQYVGSLIGESFGGRVDSVYSLGSINGVSSDVGILIGSLSSSLSIVNNSYSIGNVSGSSFVGGLAGRNVGHTLNSYSIGSVIGTSSVGGLVGGNYNTISNSYTVSNVSGTSNVGSLVGLRSVIPPSQIINSAWYNHTGNPNNCYSGGNSGCTVISEGNHPPYFYFIDNSPMSSWDFDNVWSSINNGIDYPVLRWEVD